MIGRSFSELGQVDWASLRHAYGSAEDVPTPLEAIAVGDADAYDDAFGTIWQQWTTYSATPYAAPFLTGILEESQSRQGILSLLAVMSGEAGEGQEAVMDALATGLPLYIPCPGDEHLLDSLEELQEESESTTHD